VNGTYFCKYETTANGENIRRHVQKSVTQVLCTSALKTEIDNCIRKPLNQLQSHSDGQYGVFKHFMPNQCYLLTVAEDSSIEKRIPDTLQILPCTRTLVHQALKSDSIKPSSPIHDFAGMISGQSHANSAMTTFMKASLNAAWGDSFAILNAKQVTTKIRKLRNKNRHRR